MAFALVGILFASVVSAQQSAEVRHVGLVAALQLSYQGLKAEVTAEAAKMPDAAYGSKPSSMPEVRTFGQVIAHIADAQFAACANAKGVESPAQGKHLERDLKTKADFTKALADSFAFCDEVFSTASDENMLLPVRVQLGPNLVEMPRASVLYGLLAHTSEMYGIGTVYLRAKGLVPPASQPPGRGRGGE